MKTVTTNRVCWFLSLNHNRHNLNDQLDGKPETRSHVCSSEWAVNEGGRVLKCVLQSLAQVLMASLLQSFSKSIRLNIRKSLCRAVLMLWFLCVVAIAIYMYIYIYIYIDVQTYYVIPNTKNE